MKPYTLSRGDDPKRYFESYCKYGFKRRNYRKNTSDGYILEQLFKITR